MTNRIPHPVAMSEEKLQHPRSLAAFRSTKLLVGCYLALSGLTLVALALLRSDTARVIVNGSHLRGVFAAR